MNRKTPLERYIDERAPLDRRKAYEVRQKALGYRSIKLRVHAEDEASLRQHAEELLRARRVAIPEDGA